MIGANAISDLQGVGLLIIFGALYFLALWWDSRPRQKDRRGFPVEPPKHADGKPPKP